MPTTNSSVSEWIVVLVAWCVQKNLELILYDEALVWWMLYKLLHILLSCLVLHVRLGPLKTLRIWVD